MMTLSDCCSYMSGEVRLPPLRTLVMDFTMTHVRFGCSHLHPMGQLMNIRHSDGSPDPDILKVIIFIKEWKQGHQLC